MKSVCAAGSSGGVVADLDERLAEALAEEAAVGLGEDRLRDLVAAADLAVVELGVERVQPAVDARLDRRADRVEHARAEREQPQPDEHERDPVRRDVDEREEAAEEHERRAEVLDDEQQHHRRAPDRQQRPEVLERRERDPHEAARADDEHLARVAQVGRQEDDDRDLRQLRGLKGDRAHAERQVGAVRRAAEARQQQQQDAAERDDVAVALEHAMVVAQRDDRRREDDQADDEPLRLVAREVLVEAVEHHQAEAGEHGDEREEVRVGVGQRHAQHEVRGEAEREEDRAVGQRQVRQQLVALDEDRGEAGGQQQRRRDQREELAVAGVHSGRLRGRARARGRGRMRRRGSAACGRRAACAGRRAACRAERRRRS